MDECLFCDIVNNKIPCEKLIENDSIIAFRDINPQAPTHILIGNVNALTAYSPNFSIRFIVFLPFFG